MLAGTSIAFAPLLPWPAIAALAAAALVLSGLGLYARANGALWRALAFATLLLALLNPALVAEQREMLKDVAAVIVDQSESQRIGERPAQTEAALRRIEAQAAQMRDTLELRVVRVGRKAGDATTGTGSGDLADKGTRLLTPLARALADVPARRIAGAILLTDGQIQDAPSKSQLAATARTLPAPLHVLLTGQENETDRRLVIVRAPTFGIVGKEIEMTIRIEDSGSKGRAGTNKTAMLTIRRDGGKPLRAVAPVGIDHRMTFTLDHAGPTVFEIEVATKPGELTEINNRAVVSVNGVRDRLRVLLVSGEPHLGERTWRNLLKSDPSVDLIHFTILRPPEKQDGTPIRELSLISFPTRELFEVKIKDFDLVIFDRYRRRGVLPSAYLRNVIDYVADGGALLEAVGPTFASPFSIYRTPLGEALPGEPTGEVIERGFLPRVTAVGRRHPVTADLPGSGKAGGAPQWGRWFRQIDVSVKRGRTLMSGADGQPLLILDRFGKGRVAQFNSDQIWLWARGFEGGGPQAELLRRLAHWLMKEPELEEKDLRATVRGDRLEITRRDIDGTSRPVTVRRPDGTTVAVAMRRKRDGVYTGTVPVAGTGLYRISDSERVFMAAAGPLNPVEFADVRATADILAPLAAATGGAMRRIDDGIPGLRRVARGRDTAGRDWIGLVANGDYIVTGVRSAPLLPALIVLLLALGATALAWRREGD